MTKYILVLTLLISSCRNNGPATTNAADADSGSKNETAVAESQVKAQKDSVTMRLVLQFYSDGSGSDYPSIIAYEDSIGSFSGRIGKNIDYLKKPWGREGETEFCLGLKELTQTEQKEFVDFTRKVLKNAKHVNIYENAACRH